MKIVLDTNVLASGIFWGGKPLKILELWNKKRVQVLASESILREYLGTIERISVKLQRPDLYRSWSPAVGVNEVNIQVLPLAILLDFWLRTSGHLQ